MPVRLDPYIAAPEAMKALKTLEAYVRNCGLEQSLVELVKARASQLNGCAYCIHMHTRDARRHGETEERLYLLGAWREAPLYSDRERAALAWTEAITMIADNGAPDTDYALLKEHFSDEEQVKLTILITTINTWNRVNVGFGTAIPLDQSGKL
jgi:AhpD family alkylhydroperoxidase